MLAVVMTNSKRILFLCGQLGVMMLARFLFQWVIDFADQHISAASSEVLFSASAVGALMLGFRIFDGLSDPVAGTLSDLWVRRGHERRRLLFLSFFLPAVGLALCFLPEFSMSIATRWVFLVSGMFLFFIGYTFYAIPYWSLLKEYSAGDPNERRYLSMLLGAGTILASAIGFIVSPILVEHFGYFSSAMGFGVVSAVLMLGPYFAGSSVSKVAEIAEKDPPSFSFGKTLSGFIKALSHRRFLALILLCSGSQMSFAVVTAAAPFIAVELLGGTRSDVLFLTGPLIILTIPGFLFSPTFSKKYGWEKSMLISSLLLGLVYVCGSCIGTSIFPSSLLLSSIIFAFAGPMTAVLLALEGEGVTDCANERKEESAGLYFGMLNLIVKSLNGAAILITGLLVEASHGPWGIEAIRSMLLVAGGLLFLGVVGYFISRKLSFKINQS